MHRISFPPFLFGARWLHALVLAAFTFVALAATPSTHAVGTTPQTITFPELATLLVGESQFLEATSTSDLPVAYELTSGPGVIEGFLVIGTGPGLVTIRATQPGDDTFAPAVAVVRSFVVSSPPPVEPQPQTLTFPALVNTPVGEAQQLDASASSGLNVDYELVSGEAVIAGFLITATAPGPITVRALQLGDSTYLPATPIERTFTATAAPDPEDPGPTPNPTTPQTITFAALANTTVGDAQLLDASASSDLPVSFELVSGPATLAGPFVTATAPGLITVRALQPGDSTFLPAAPVTRSFTATAAPDPEDPGPGPTPTTPQTITFASLTNVIVGESQLLDASASSDLPVSFELVSGPATIDGPFVTATAPGLITVRALQPGDSTFLPALPVTRSFTASAAPDPEDPGPTPTPTIPQTITFAPPASMLVGEIQFLDAFATSDLPVTFTLVSGPATLDGFVLTATGLGTVTLRATQPGDSTFLPAPAVTLTVTVTPDPIDPGPVEPTPVRVAQEIDFPLPPPVTYGDPAIFLGASADSGLPVTVSVLSGPGVLEGDFLIPTGAGNIVLRAIQTGNPAYLPAPIVTVTIPVAKATLLVTLDEDQVRLTGSDNPLLTPTYFGFVGEDTVADLDRRPVITFGAKKSSPAGDYPITLSAGLDNNYDFVFGPARTLSVVGYGGAYETLLLDPETSRPLGRLELTVSPTTSAFTGRLDLAREPAPISLKGRLALDFDSNATSELTLTLKGSSLLPARTYTLQFQLEPSGLRVLLLLDDIFLADGTGPALYVLPARTTAPWIGAHTLALFPPADVLPGTPTPAGAGHATATIARTGQLAVRGRLADGTTLTSTLKPDPAGAYRLFARPYGKRLDSALAGPLALEPHPTLDLRFHVPRDGSRLTWSKAPAPKDKTYPAGFTALALPVALDPWLPPAAARRATPTTPALPAANLAQRLGLIPDPVTGNAPFGLDYLPAPEAAFTLAQIDTLPAALDLSAKGQPLIPKGLSAKPTLKFNPSTGAVTGGFVLLDTVPAPTTKNPAATRTITRKVALSGTLRQPPATEPAAPLGLGHFLVPDLTKGPTPTSGEFQVLAP